MPEQALSKDSAELPELWDSSAREEKKSLSQEWARRPRERGGGTAVVVRPLQRMALLQGLVPPSDDQAPSAGPVLALLAAPAPRVKDGWRDPTEPMGKQRRGDGAPGTEPLAGQHQGLGLGVLSSRWPQRSALQADPEATGR